MKQKCLKVLKAIPEVQVLKKGPYSKIWTKNSNLATLCLCVFVCAFLPCKKFKNVIAYRTTCPLTETIICGRAADYSIKRRLRKVFVQFCETSVRKFCSVAV